MRHFSMSAVAVAFVVATVLGCGGTAEPQSSQEVADLHESKGPALFATGRQALRHLDGTVG